VTFVELVVGSNQSLVCQNLFCDKKNAGQRNRKLNFQVYFDHFELDWKNKCLKFFDLAAVTVLYDLFWSSS